MTGTTQRFTFPVTEVRSIKDPVRDRIKTIYALIKVKDLPDELPLDPNPREQNFTSKVAKSIIKGLVEDEVEGRFHLLNRGITISAYEVTFNSDKKLLTLAFKTGDESYGIVDGGHTYKIILKHRHELGADQSEPGKSSTDQYVRLEILTGIEEFILEIVQARNTSMQVQDKSLADRAGDFDWIKKEVAKNFKNSDDLIAYKENDSGEVDIRDIIGLLTLFNSKLSKTNKTNQTQPIVAYTSKQKCLDQYLKNVDSFKRLAPVMGEIFELYDYIQLRAPEIWNEGKSGNGEEDGFEDTKSGKYGLIRGVKKLRRSAKVLPFLGRKTPYVTPDGWIYPIMASFRYLLNDDDKTISWKTKPKPFFDRNGRKLLEITKETNDKLGGNPNAVGKTPNHWDQLFDKVKVLHAGL